MNFFANFTPRKYRAAFVHFFSLLMLSLFAFSYNHGLLLQGNDGPTNISIAESQAFLFGITPHLHGNFLEGIGNISFPFNCIVQPGFWLVAHGNMSVLSQALLYCWFVFQLFVSVLLIGFNHDFSRHTRYIAAWLLTLIAFPYFSEWRLYPLTVNTPQFLNIITVFAIIDLGIQGMGARNWLTAISYGGIVLLGAMIGLMLCPAHVLLIVPMVLASLIYSLKLSSRDEIKRKLIVSAGVILFFGFAGWIEYYLGLMLNTAAVVFYAEMEHVHPSLLYVSILYHWNLDGAKLGPLFFCASLCAILYTILKVPKFKSLAITVLIMLCLILSVGTIATLLSTSWTAPEPIYFEMLLLPFFALIIAQVYEHISRQKRWAFPILLRYHWLLPFFFAVMVMLVIYFEVPHSTTHRGYHLTPHSTPVTEVLDNEIGLHQNALFRGRVANILPHKGFIDQLNYFSALDVNTGNDHQSTGLWLKHIPTLHEYNQLLSPSFFFLYRSFLSDRLEDKPFRSWSNFSVVNPKILRLLGVKFVLSDTPSIAGGYYRARLAQTNGIPNLYLFELKDSNTAGISVRNIIMSDGVRQAAHVMDDPAFNIQDAVVTNHNSIPKLVPASESIILLDNGGIRVKASSSGSSLLILPMEYSHCLHMNVISGSRPKLIRVDIALTGFLFTNKVDVILDNRLSLFDNPRCRLKDYREFSQLLKNN